MTTVAEFEIDYHPFLDAQGTLREPAPAPARDSAEIGTYAWCMPIASQMSHGARAAMAFTIRKEPRCSVT